MESVKYLVIQIPDFHYTNESGFEPAGKTEVVGVFGTRSNAETLMWKLRNLKRTGPYFAIIKYHVC